MRIIRSEFKPLPKDYVMCGNCHGTGQSDFGLGASWGGDCDACDGRGMIYMDPNVKGMSLEEFLAYTEEQKTEREGK